jgi:signal peptidase II
MMFNIKRSALILVIFMLSIICDQTSKQMAIKYLQPVPQSSYLFDLIRLQYTENVGAMLSIGDSLSESARFWLFTVVVAILLIGVIIYAHTVSFRNYLKIIGLSLIAGGGMSNLIDRISNNGAVVDFMSIGIGTLRTGIFNVADFLILVGIVMVLIFHSHRG